MSVRVVSQLYSRWNNPSIVAEGYRDFKLDNLELYCDYFKNFNYDPENPDAPSSFKELLTTVRNHKHNCFLLTGRAGTGKTTLLTAMYERALKEWANQTFRRNLGVESVWKVHAKPWRNNSVSGRCATKAGMLKRDPQPPSLRSPSIRSRKL